MTDFVRTETILSAVEKIEAQLEYLNKTKVNVNDIDHIAGLIMLMNDTASVMRGVATHDMGDDITKRCVCIHTSLLEMLEVIVESNPVGMWITATANINDIALVADIIVRTKSNMKKSESLDNFLSLGGLGIGIYNPMLKSDLVRVVDTIRARTTMGINDDIYTEMYRARAGNPVYDVKRDVTKEFLTHLYAVLYILEHGELPNKVRTHNLAVIKEALKSKFPDKEFDF